MVRCPQYERALRRKLVEQCVLRGVFDLSQASEEALFAAWRGARASIMVPKERAHFIALSEKEQRTYCTGDSQFRYDLFVSDLSAQMRRSRIKVVH